MSIANPINTILEERLSESQRITLELYKDRLFTGLWRFSQNRIAIVGLTFLILTFLMAILAPIVAPYEPLASLRLPNGAPATLQPPSRQFLMGTTHLGRDVFSQWLYGARISLLVAFCSGFVVFAVGTTVGLVAGYYKGTVDLVLMRLVDVLYGIPALPLVLVVALFFGSSVWNVIIAMVLVLWRTMARVVRSQTLTLAERPFVKAARAAGASDFRIMYIHILPNLIPLILIEATFVMGAAILIEAGVSFLGLGATETVSWGTMLELTFSSGAIREAWWWVLPPGLSITALVVAFFYISRGIEEVTNPELER